LSTNPKRKETKSLKKKSFVGQTREKEKSTTRGGKLSRAPGIGRNASRLNVGDSLFANIPKLEGGGRRGSLWATEIGIASEGLSEKRRTGQKGENHPGLGCPLAEITSGENVHQTRVKRRPAGKKSYLKTS